MKNHWFLSGVVWCLHLVLWGGSGLVVGHLKLWLWCVGAGVPGPHVLSKEMPGGPWLASPDGRSWLRLPSPPPRPMLLLGAQTWLCPQRLGNCKMLQLWLPRQKGTPCVEYLSFSVYVMGTLPRLSHIILTITPGGKYSYFS
jgi:hypothetical protein